MRLPKIRSQALYFLLGQPNEVPHPAATRTSLLPNGEIDRVGQSKKLIGPGPPAASKAANDADAGSLESVENLVSAGRN